jgi:hypothetical protein
MCYDLSVMLRGRRSCVVSGRPRTPFAPKNPLSPIIPAHPRHSHVSPMIPALTQKEGGRGVADPSKTMIFSTDPLRLSSPGDFNRLEKCVPNCELSTGHPVKDAHPERVRRGGQVEGSRSSLSPLFTATSINIVGAPTFLLDATHRLHVQPRRVGMARTGELE